MCPPSVCLPACLSETCLSEVLYTSTTVPSVMFGRRRGTVLKLVMLEPKCMKITLNKTPKKCILNTWGLFNYKCGAQKKMKDFFFFMQGTVEQDFEFFPPQTTVLLLPVAVKCAPVPVWGWS